MLKKIPNTKFIVKVCALLQGSRIIFIQVISFFILYRTLEKIFSPVKKKIDFEMLLFFLETLCKKYFVICYTPPSYLIMKFQVLFCIAKCLYYL